MTAHLKRRGHRVVLCASGAASALMSGEELIEIEGFELRYGRGALRRGSSAAANLRRAPRVLRRNLGRALGRAVAVEPDVVITDFDSFSHGVGKLLGVPVISLDHHHVIDRCAHTREIERSLPRDFGATRAIVRAKTPGCARYVVSSFFAPEVRPALAATTALVGPILRPEIESLEPRDGDHFLVYQTSAADPALLAKLQHVRARFVVFGRGAMQSHRSANVEVRPFDEAGFAEALAGARGVIAHGGHTAIAEALHLGKPVLSIPLRHQGEQELNAAYLEVLGLGARAARPTTHALSRFVSEADGNRARRRRVRSGTDDACRALDRALAEVHDA